jgi:hypothetical protein
MLLNTREPREKEAYYSEMEIRYLVLPMIVLSYCLLCASLEAREAKRCIYGSQRMPSRLSCNEAGSVIIDISGEYDRS